MDTQQPKKRDKGGEVGEEKPKQEGKENPTTTSTTSTKQKQSYTITSSPPSSSSSPSHEFSFTISLHSSSGTGGTATATAPDKTTKSPPSFAIDLSPADDIFFHGHLLPLTLLSHLPISPRSSTNSLDSFSLPVKDLFEERKQNHNILSSKSTNNKNHSSNSKKRSHKVKSFPLFSKWRKGYEVGGEKEINKDEEDETVKKKRKVRFNVSHIFKRYIRIIRPLLVFRGGRRDKGQLRRQPCSFSGNLAYKGKQELRGRRGEHSAPASMWTSPTNSGLLVASPTLHSSKSDSTMEELQSAIQAAIAHCKNSVSVKEDKIKC